MPALGSVKGIRQDGAALWTKLRLPGVTGPLPPLGIGTPGLSPMFCGRKSRSLALAPRRVLIKGWMALA